MHSVFKEWLFDLPYRMQSVLASSLRGCDIAKKDDNSKYITRAIRGLVLNNADPTNSFIVGDGTVDDKYLKPFLSDLDSYPLHFVMHLTHATEIIGYKHPLPEVRTYWLNLYKEIVKALHLNPETENQIDVRLGFTQDEKRKISIAERPLDMDKTTPVVTPVPTSAKPNTPKVKWDAGTGTSHRKSDYD